MTTETHKEIDLLEAVRPAFEAGKGVILLQKNMPDAALLLAIKQAASFGKPFTVVPADAADARGASPYLVVAQQAASDLQNLG